MQTWLAHRLSLQHLAAVLMPNLADLVPSFFFCQQPWHLQRSEHIFPGKTPAFIVTPITCITLNRVEERIA